MKIPKKIPTNLLELTPLINAINELFVLLDDEDISEEEYNQCPQTIGLLCIGTLYGNGGIDIVKPSKNKLDR